MNEKTRIDPDARLALVLLRYSTFLDQAGFARTARISPSQVSLYERGEGSVPWKVLEKAADAAGFPRPLLRPLVRAIQSFRLACKGWSRIRGLLLETLVSGLIEISGEVLNLVGTPIAVPQPVVGPSVSDRDVAQELWLRMKQRTPGQRRALVEEVEEFRNWALSERVAEESVATAPSSPPKALELAQLAVQIAELLPGEDWLRCRTQGYAWFHVSNAHKASGDFGDADAALVKARTLWAAGAPGKPGFLSEAIALALEAKLHQSRRRFHLGLQRIDEALAADTGELKARLLLNKAQILDALGNTETASAVLREAVSYIDEQQDPRAALGVRFQFLLNLCLAGRAREAAPGLRVVRALAEKVGQGLDVSRVEWLTGKIAAGCSQAKEAETAFEQARKEFASSDPPLAFDYALVSLDLALLLLEQNRTSEVRPLAEQTVNLFRRYGIQREALAALQIYCEAAKREDATVELTRQVIRFLHRSQHDPELTFNGNEPGTEGQR